MPDQFLSLERETISYKETGFLAESIIDYLNDQPRLRPFYGRRPDIAAFKEQMEEKAKSYLHRESLVAVLREQYAKAKLKSDSIDKLADDRTFTITTGHQVCLFTGPLYFFYKIVSTINTTRELAKAYPDYHFVPVFWMATEDHDFAEANHFYLPSGKVEWESGQGGAVGRMDLVGMEEVAEELKEKIGIGYESGELLDLFRRAYIDHGTVTDATRFLVDHFFGKYGVIAIDGDDQLLKSAMIPYFKKELQEKTSFKAVQRTNSNLRSQYPLQVTPREINLFYLESGFRERIIKTQDGEYEVLQSDLAFSEEEMMNELNSHPERFSPNVILRPLFQEVILPNLAYIGGGGELNYWFQLKGAFDDFQVSFPILMLRNSVLLIDKASSDLMKKLNVSVEDVVTKTEMDLEEDLVRAESSEVLNLKEELEKLESLFLSMESKLRRVEKLLEKSVRSGYVRSERIVKNLEIKMLRAEKKKHEILMGRLHKLRSKLFPRNGLQERNVNFCIPYIEFGSDFVDMLVENTDPFSGKYTVLRIR